MKNKNDKPKIGVRFKHIGVGFPVKSGYYPGYVGIRPKMVALHPFAFLFCPYIWATN